MRLTGTERPGADARDVTPEAEAWLADLLTFWRQKYPDVEVIPEVVHASPGRVLAGASARADLVVLGRNSADDSACDLRTRSSFRSGFCCSLDTGTAFG
ncbi:MAG TPA: hypothetical protein VH307_25940 [Streptosporangiaceae bacterium]|nr:hypothetical protein [Streptosporangiaceae bacterium]